MKKVGTSECGCYEGDVVDRALRDSVLALPELCRTLQGAARVLVKPNLLSSSCAPEDRPVNTHPAVIHAVIRLLQEEFGCEVSVGDSCGSLTPDSTAQALKNSGVVQVAERAGAAVYNVDRQPRRCVSFREGRLYKEIPLPSNLDEFDLIISLAKFKTHHLTTITCAMKNLLGLVPGAAKKEAHLKAPRAEEFATLLCDLYACLGPTVGIVDAVVGMEGSGPNNGTARGMGFLAASNDCVALDSVCARIMGLNPHRVPMLEEGYRRGLGEIAVSEIEVMGEPVESLRCEDFQLPPSMANSLLLRLCPRWMFRLFFNAFTSLHAEIDQDACVRCGECVRNCPSHTIEQDPETGRCAVDPSGCIRCYCCDEVCPADAIEMRRNVLGRIFRRD
ncbi:MAG: DUF362 domain-containing protein [Planctomycetota bacterium]